MVIFDSTFTLLLLSDKVAAPVDDGKERIEFLIERLEKSKTKIVIPTPVLSEILVESGNAGPKYVSTLNASSRFKIIPFDTKAAVEVALLTMNAKGKGDKKGGSKNTWAKIKYDRQIIGIAKAFGIKTIYSDDNDIKTFGAQEGIEVVGLVDLPLRPEDIQKDLFKDKKPDHVKKEEDTPEPTEQ